MESHKLAFKLFFDPASAPGPGEFVPVFHSWIQQHSVPDHLLIDVADYSHVPEGPQTVLVSHEAIFAIDYAEGRPGLQYFRKQPIAGAESFAERLRKVFRIELESCARLEEDPRLEGRVRFRRDEIVFRIHDRLLAPNEPGVFAELRPELHAFASELFDGSPVTLEQRGTAQELFEVRIKSGKNASLSALLSRSTSG